MISFNINKTLHINKTFQWHHLLRTHGKCIYSHPVDGYLLLAYRAVMGEIFQSRGEVSARLHSFQHICRAKFATVQTQDALEHFRFLTLDTTWDLTVGCVYSAILCKRVNKKQVKGIFWSGPPLTSTSSNFFSWIRNCCSLIVITLSGCFKTCAASGENKKYRQGQQENISFHLTRDPFLSTNLKRI